MAKQQQITVVYSDDLTGEELSNDTVHTVEFSLDGTSYEIDLSSANAASLRNDFAAWVGHARKVTGARSARRRTPRAAATGSAAASKEQNTAIREWARANGHTVSERGRISATIVEAFHKAN